MHIWMPLIKKEMLFSSHFQTCIIKPKLSFNMKLCSWRCRHSLKYFYLFCLETENTPSKLTWNQKHLGMLDGVARTLHCHNVTVFGAHVCIGIFKHLPQPLRSHEQRFVFCLQCPRASHALSSDQFDWIWEELDIRNQFLFETSQIALGLATVI